MVLNLKLSPGYLLYLARGDERLCDIVKALFRCGESDKAIFITKPSVVSVWLDRERPRRIVIPPSSIAMDPEIPKLCGIGRADYQVAEETWVDGKPFPRARAVSKVRDRCLLVESLERVFGSLSGGENGRCYVSCGGDTGKLVKSLLNPLVFDLSTLSDADIVRVEGFIDARWPSHPVLYGLIFKNRVSLTIADVSRTILRHYVKPLAYLGSHAILYEVPYSSSILFAGYNNDLLEVAVRAVLYSC